MVFIGSRCRPWLVQGGSDPYSSAPVHELNGNFHTFAEAPLLHETDFTLVASAIGRPAPSLAMKAP